MQPLTSFLEEDWMLPSHVALSHHSVLPEQGALLQCGLLSSEALVLPASESAAAPAKLGGFANPHMAADGGFKQRASAQYSDSDSSSTTSCPSPMYDSCGVDSDQFLADNDDDCGQLSSHSGRKRRHHDMQQTHTAYAPAMDSSPVSFLASDTSSSHLAAHTDQDEGPAFKKQASATTAAPAANTTRVRRAEATVSHSRSRSSDSDSPSDDGREATPKADFASSAEGVDVKQLLQEEEIRRRRLARKAELARLSRRRKKDRLTDLEEENQQLLKSLESLRDAHRKTLEELNHTRLQSQITGALSNTLQASPVAVKQETTNDSAADSVSSSTASETPASQAESAADEVEVKAEHQPQSNGFSAATTVADCEVSRINQLASELGQLANASASASEEPKLQAELLAKTLEFEAAQRNRHRLMQFMLNCLAQGLQQSSRPARFLQWILCRSERFYEDPNGLWHSLTSEELNLSPEQIRELQCWRQQVMTAKQSEPASADSASPSSSSESQSAAPPSPVAPTGGESAFHPVMLQAIASLDQEAWLNEQLLQLLTPLQFAKFCAFVTSFGDVCMKIDA